MFLRTLFATVTLFFLSPLPVQAAELALDLLDPALSYSADFTFTNEKGTYHGMAWHAPGRERRDYMTKSGSQSVVVRRDTNTVFLMNIDARWSVSLALSSVAGLVGGLDTLQAERTPLGPETVNGMATTRYKVKGTSAKGGRFEGEAWFSKDGIMMRAEGTVTPQTGNLMRIKTELSNVKVTEVIAATFDVPTNMTSLDLHSVPAEGLEQSIKGLLPLLQRRK